MSRRKQAKPRSLKRDERETDVFDDESTQDTLPLVDTLSRDNHESPIGVSIVEVSNTAIDDEYVNDADDVQKYTCSACNASLETLSSFLKHLNTECMAGSNGGIGTPSSLRSSDTPDDLSLSPSSCLTQSDPDADLSYTVGVTENTPYGCQFCDKAFPRLSYLKRHEQVHSDQMPFRCEYCQRLFKHKRSRDRHVKLHTGDRKYRCSHCESAFSRSDHLKIHMKTHDNAKPYQCTVCNRGYNTAAALSSHMQNHKKEGSTPDAPLSNSSSYKCGQCAFTFTSSGELQTHLSRHCRTSISPETKPLPCNLCPQLCASPGELKDHITQSHQDQQERCVKCQEEQLSPKANCRHNSTPEEGFHHSRTIPVDSVSPGLNLTCGFCSKSDFPTLESLQLHVQVLHVPVSDSVPILQSSIRAPIPSHKSRQTPHHRTQQHLGNSTFDCELCRQTFSSVQALQKHTLGTHSFSEVVVQKFISDGYCSQCNSEFPNSNSLLDHLMSVHESSPTARQESSPTPPIYLRKPSSKTSPSKRSLIGSRLRPNGTKLVKTSVMLGSPPMMFNGHAPRPSRQDSGGVDGSGNGDGASTVASTSTTTLLCSQCNAAFPDFESFRTHLKSHLDSAAGDTQKYSCSECDGEFGSQHLLDGHLVGHFLASTTEYGCQACLKLFSKPDDLQKHLLDIHSHHLYRCALCKEIFDSKVSIQVHFAVKHSNECRTLRCISCNSVFRTELEFQVHVKLSHLSTKSIHPLRCLFCDQLFVSESQLQFHMSTHKKQFPCNLCDEAFHVEFLLDRHVQTSHANNVPQQEHLQHPFRGISADTGEVAQNLSVKRSASHAERDDQGLSGSTAPAGEVDIGSPSAANSSCSGREFRCDICDCCYATESSLNIHRRQAHNIRTSQKGGGQSAAVSLFCAYCNESCKSRTDLENHMKAHTASPSKHKCNICDEICPTASTLAEHKLTHCKVVASSTCIVCRVPLTTEDQFFTHVQQHNSHGLPVPCVVCRQTLITDVEIQMHAKFHLKNCEPHKPCCVCSRCYEVSNMIITGKRDFGGHTYMCKDCFHSKGDDPRCSECGVKFETLDELEAHRRSAHKKTYQCIKCQMSFDTELDIQAHVTCHVLHEGTNHECRLCHKVLDSPSKLQCHLIEHTFEGCSNYTCYMCSSVFTGPHLLQQHMLEHGLDTRPYDCSSCHQSFFFRAELENHAFVHLDETPSVHSRVFTSPNESNSIRNILKCSLCPLVFVESSEMQRHHFQCHSDSDLRDNQCFPCGECGKEFPCMSNLQGHMRLHARGTKHTCPECNKEFALSKNLHVHLRSHSGEKPYECPICNKRFARKENRKAHMKSHAGHKPFMCPHCGKTFSRRSHVKEHMRIHITSTTHPCESCSESFPSTRLLRRHLKETHQKHYDHVCTVCGDVFEHAKNLDNHLQKNHQVRTTANPECSGDEMSESSGGATNSSPSLEHKGAGYSSDCESDVVCADDTPTKDASPPDAAGEDKQSLFNDVAT